MSYDISAKRDKAVVDEAMQSYMACSFCGKLTLIATLSEYGARCFACFERYCRGGKDQKHVTEEEKEATVAKLRALSKSFGHPADPKAWAYELQSREQSGERLTPFQRKCWREAIGEPA